MNKKNFKMKDLPQATRPYEKCIANGAESVVLKNKTTGETYDVVPMLSGRSRDIILAGGLLGYTKESSK